jgi:octaprenyl-diphosphate synthase
LAIIVKLEDGKSDGEHAVSNLKSLVADDLERVNDVIIEHMESPVDMIPNLAGHLINSGGKRLRPMLTLACARMCGYEGTAHVKLAAAVEFIHTATLLHDDVIDESDLRRGTPTANTIWGNQASVLVGDFLFSRAFQLMVVSGDLKVLDILSGAAAIITEGEVLQLMTANNMATTEDSYLKVINGKTAALFEAACRVGAVIAGDRTDQEEALLSYGKNLGIAFQLVDDALDYSGAQAKLGKTVGDDFREGKVTLPIVLAYRRGSDGDREFWRRTIEQCEQKDGDLETAIQLLEKHGALADTIERARHYGSIARDALAIFPESDYANSLDGIVEFCVSRTF